MVVESVKAAADVYAPVSGEVVAVNSELDSAPEKINEDPYVEWAAGETVIWQNNTQHLAANMGMTDRYTLQITGVPDENIFLQ